MNALQRLHVRNVLISPGSAFVLEERFSTDDGYGSAFDLERLEVDHLERRGTNRYGVCSRVYCGSVCPEMP